MNKTELIDHVAEIADITKAAANRALDAVCNAISTALEKGDKVTIPGFGNFEVRKRAAREGRNPQTGLTIKIPASNVAAFKPSQVLKNIVNHAQKKG